MHLKPKAQVHYCDHVFVRRPSSVRPSVRPSSLTFHIFDFSSETAEQNLTKLYRKVDLNVLYQVCVFWADRKNKMAALASDWLRHFRLLLWNRWSEFNETWHEARPQRPLPSLCFSGRSEKTRWPPWPLIGWGHFRLLLWNRWMEFNENLTGSKISMSSTKFVFFRADRKNKMAALASDWLRHFRLLLWNRWAEFNETLQEARPQRPSTKFVFFRADRKKQDGRPGLWLAETFSTSSLKTAEWNFTKLDRKQDLNVLYQVCVFSGRSEKTRWPPWPLIGWDIFDFFSETAERNSTKLDRKQDLNVLYQVCVFRADRKNKMAALVSDWLRHFRLLLWNRWSEFNETWQEARPQRPLPSLCFSGQSEKQDGRPGLWLAETFSTSPLKTAERNWTKLDRKQDLNVLYQVCVFWADQDDRPWPIPQKRWHIVLRCTICDPLGLLFKTSMPLKQMHIDASTVSNEQDRQSIWIFHIQ